MKKLLSLELKSYSGGSGWDCGNNGHWTTVVIMSKLNRRMLDDKSVKENDQDEANGKKQ